MNDYGTVLEAGTVRFERLLPGPIERIWAYLTDSEKRGTWLAKGSIEPRVGGRVELTWHNAELVPRAGEPPEDYRRYEGYSMTGRVTAYEPPRLLAYTWGGEASESEVVFELTPKDDRVLLVLTHRQLATREAMVSVSGGWHTHLGILAARLEGTAPEPFWTTHERVQQEYERRIG